MNDHLRTRTRISPDRVPVHFGGQLFSSLYGGSSWNDMGNRVPRAFGRSEICVDEPRGKHWNQRILWSSQTRGFTDHGGTFDKRDLTISQPDYVYLYRKTGDKYASYEWFARGPTAVSPEYDLIARNVLLGDFPSLPSTYAQLTASTLRGMGAEAVNRTLPTDPGVSIATSAGELRERLPSIVGLQFIRKPGAKSTGGEWLNFQFGIKPILADIRNFADAMKEADKTLQQWYRDSGRKIRRRYTFPRETSHVSKKVETNRYLPDVNSGVHQPGTLTTTVKADRRVWFSGAYTYHAPEKDAWDASVRELDRVYGILPDLETAWNLTAWTWLIDWFTNAGSVVGNLNAFAVDRLVLLYGYLMCHEKCTVEYSWTGKVYEANNLVTRTYTTSIVHERKRRVRAEPFGLGFTGGELSAYQLSILAALGISRHR